MPIQYRVDMKERTSPRRSQALPPLRSERLLDQVRERVRYLHYSIRTEQAYVHWVRAFVRFHGVRHPAEMGAAEVEAFLTWLAAERRVAAATHRQALSAIVFLYEKVLGLDLPWLAGIGRPQARGGCRSCCRTARSRPCCRASRRPSIGSSPSCSTAPACASWKACACASRTSTSNAARSSSAKARAPRTGW